METSIDVPAEATRTQLDRILASPGFVHSDRMARFLRKTKKPAWALKEIHRAHYARWSMEKLSAGTTRGLSLARDKLVFSTADTTGNIWMAERER